MKTISFFSFLLFTTSLIAQTITSTSVPKPLDLIQNQSVDSVSAANLVIGTTGTGKNWDFSKVKKDSLDAQKVQFQTPSASIKAVLPTCNLIAYETITPTDLLCYELNASGLYQIGAANDNGVYPANKKLIKLPLNMSIGYSARDTQEVIRYDSLGNILDTLHLNYTNTADASGTLKTPKGTFTTLRYKTYFITKEVFDVGAGTPVNFFIRQYDWFAPNYRGSIFTYVESGVYSELFGVEVIASKNASFLTGTGVATSDLKVNNILRLYPNPASELISMEIKNAKNEIASYQIVNIAGIVLIDKKMELQQGVQTISIDISTLNKGGFFLMLKDANNTIMGNQVFIKE
jgi:Secretion system C-terminal sorting domain